MSAAPPPGAQLCFRCECSLYSGGSSPDSTCRLAGCRRCTVGLSSKDWPPSAVPQSRARARSSTTHHTEAGAK